MIGTPLFAVGSTWAMATVGVPAPFVLFVVAARDEARLGRWVQLRQIELPRGALR
ncbi:hypothetical protein [Streptomyces sp. A244]|uniref:hypothetical protein n=1 Tax=Streptomyces sp. A244 TaxID=2137016 RepID=UPI0015E77A44|nr:hypothetical protein [Streptomyces sp. A244]